MFQVDGNIGLAVAFSLFLAFFISVLSYMFRWALVRGFLYQRQAEQSTASIKDLINSLPDAILMISEINKED